MIILLRIVCTVGYYITKTSANSSAVYWSQFYINFSRQEHQIDFLYVSFKTWDSQVSAYTPFHFSFTVPLMIRPRTNQVESCRELWLLGYRQFAVQSSLKSHSLWVTLYVFVFLQSKVYCTISEKYKQQYTFYVNNIWWFLVNHPCIVMYKCTYGFSHKGCVRKDDLKLYDMTIPRLNLVLCFESFNGLTYIWAKKLTSLQLLQGIMNIRKQKI